MRKMRCKFYVSQVGQSGTAGSPVVAGENLTLLPVTGPGNEPWSKWTPSGKLELYTTNPDACGMFKPGEVVYLDIARAEDVDNNG